MGCLMPITLTRKYKTICGSLTDKVPCGKCPNCVRRRASNWLFRLKKEQLDSTSSCFLTLTYDEEHIHHTFNGLMTLHKPDYQNFIKRLRETVRRDQDLTPNQKSIKYYAVGEYGTKTIRPHYHLILYNTPDSYIDTNSDILRDIWGSGMVRVDPCNPRTMAYCCGYVLKKSYKDNTIRDFDDRVPEFNAMSNGLGLSYLSKAIIKYYHDHMANYLIDVDGIKLSMPRYYKDKIYDKDQRIELQKLAADFSAENHTEVTVDQVKYELMLHKRRQTESRLKI